jgi:WD40 repeat protein
VRGLKVVPPVVLARRLFMGDEHGWLLVSNFISGGLLTRIRLHSKEVTALAYCGKNAYLITTGADGKINIVQDVSSLSASHTSKGYLWREVTSDHIIPRSRVELVGKQALKVVRQPSSGASGA